MLPYKKCGYKGYHESHAFFIGYFDSDEYVCLGYDNLWGGAGEDE